MQSKTSRQRRSVWPLAAAKYGCPLRRRSGGVHYTGVLDQRDTGCHGAIGCLLTERRAEGGFTASYCVAISLAMTARS